MRRTTTPRPILDSGMPAARWKHVAAGYVPNPSYEDHGWSKRNKLANRYAALAMYARRELKARIEKDIEAFDLGACLAALEIVQPGNPWHAAIKRREASFTARRRLAWEVSETARAALAA